MSWKVDKDGAQMCSNVVPITYFLDIWRRMDVLFYKTHSSVVNWYIIIIPYAHLYPLAVHGIKN